MKFALTMILVSAVGLFILAITRPSNPGEPPMRGNSAAPSPVPAQTPDEVALEKIKREDASGRFPFLVSSMCRDFLERYPTSSRRAEVEGMLERNQKKAGQADSKIRA